MYHVIKHDDDDDDVNDGDDDDGGNDDDDVDDDIDHRVVIPAPMGCSLRRLRIR